MGPDEVIVFVVILTLITAVSVMGLTWMRGRHRIAEIKASTQAASREDGAQVQLLTQENARLRATIGRLDERLGVLERIATDPAERTARAIESLR